ncbi:MAG: DUF4032 domain-containing protein [Acidimicrobiia bacterium]|nr:DUF4032 domain-containing protein [Acidimicrobiia bacterium]
MATPHLQIRPGNPAFLDLPWEKGVNEWGSNRLVDMPAGIHRHPVVFVAYDEGIYVIKELPERLARNEFEVLGALEDLTHKAAEPVGLVERRWLDPGEEQSAAVITRFVQHSFPYRHLVSGPGFGPRRSQMLHSLASLMVELHLTGCFWGDCSLSNVLYRYDAGEIEAIMIDAETSELHQELSDGQREQDMGILVENLAGEMADIANEQGASIDEADLSLGEDVETRYQSLWAELHQVLVIARDESYKVRERINRLHELGFSVRDVEMEPSGEGELVKMRARVGGRTYNSDNLASMAGVVASENQARVILGDLNYHLVKYGHTTPTGRDVGVFHWLTTSFQPILARITEVWPGDDPVQGYCDFLHYRMELARGAGHDIENEPALESWIEKGFPGFPLDTDRVDFDRF